MLFIDVTNSINILDVTGIQRVVKNLIQHALEYEKSEQIEFIEYDGIRKKYYRIPKDDPRLTGKQILWVAKFRNQFLYQLLKRSLTHHQKVNIVSIAEWFRTGFKTRYPLPETREDVLRPSRRDILLLADSTWNYDPWKTIRQFRENGTIIGQIVYDLLPIEYPEFFDQQLVDRFTFWYLMINYYCESIYCISNTVARRHQKLLSEENRSSCVKEVEVFNLGSDIGELGRVSEHRREDKSLKFKDKLKFLTVGTLEPRKNHNYILDKFDLLWARDRTQVQWHVAGREGWGCTQLVNRLNNHPLLDKNLFFYSDLSDQELRNLYTETDCVIIGSIDEGYGLPVIEALKYGSNILLSDIEVFREFNLNEICYFSLNDSDNSLLERIESFVNDKRDGKLDLYKNKITEVSWNESITALLDLIFMNEDDHTNRVS